MKIPTMTLEEFQKQQKTQEATDQILNQLFKENYEWVRNFVASRIFDKSSAEDITQQIFMKYFAYLRKNGIKEYPKALLRTSVDNFLRNYYRDTQRENSKGALPVSEELFAKIENPHNMEKEFYLNSVISKVMRNLQIQDREVFTLHKNGYSYSDIAKELHIPVGTVSTCVRRVRRYLKQEDIDLEYVFEI